MSPNVVCALAHAYDVFARRRRLTPRPSTLCAQARTLALLLCLPSILCAEMIDGSAVVTSRSGSIRASHSSGQSTAANLHANLHPSGLHLTTSSKGQIFLTFSNNVALAVNPLSSVQCESFTQRPFDAVEQSLTHEPSVSKLQLRLKEGKIAIASNQLSPLSELRIALPQGEVRLHKGTCLIELDATGVHLTAYQGNLTYYYPDGDARTFISAPQRVRISEQSMQRQQTAETTDLTKLKTKDAQLCRAVQHASQRVIFKPNQATAQPPTPALVVRPDYLQQPPARPYQFKD